MSTNYTHFTNLAFDSLFARGPEGQEVQIFNGGSGFSFTGPLQVPTGSASAPTFSFNADTTTGLFYGTGGLLNFASTGGLVASLSTFLQMYVPIAATNGSITSPGYSFSGSSNTGFYFDGTTLSTGIIGVNVATISQTACTISVPTSFKGTTTNNNPAAGIVGEPVSSNNGSLTSFGTSTTWANLTSISLTAGDWDVEGMVTWSINGGAGVTRNQSAISVNSGTTTTDQVLGLNQADGALPTSVFNVSQTIPRYRLSLASTTTVYLKGNATWSTNAPQYAYSISARRVR